MDLANIIAKSLTESNISIATSTPGHGVLQIFNSLNKLREQNLQKKYEISLHEELAYGIALGSSISGKRSAVILKAHGLDKAMNAVRNSLYSGVRSGLVSIIINYNKEGDFAETLFDIIPTIQAINMPYSILNSDEDVASVIKEGFYKSEYFKLPYAIIINDELFRNQKKKFKKINDNSLNFDEKDKKWMRNPYQEILCPIFASYQRKILEAKLKGENISKINIPDKKYDPPEKYKDLYNALNKYKKNDSIVFCDTGTSLIYSFPPFNTTDVMVYMGGALPLAIGAASVTKKDIWAITGDFSFSSTGCLGLDEAIRRDVNVKLIIIDNGVAAVCGNYPRPPKIVEKILQPYKEFVHKLEKKNIESIREVFDIVSIKKGLQIIIADYRRNLIN